MLKYIVFKIASLIMPHLPAKVGYRLTAFSADLAYLLAPNARRVIADNMRHVLGPDVDAGRLRRTVRGVFHNTAKNYFELIRLPRLDMGQLERNLTVFGWSHFQRIRDEGRGVIIATAHLGNVDLVVQVLAARSIGIIVLAEPLEPPALFRLVRGFRESCGLSFLPVSRSSLKIAMRSLKEGGVVALACDRDVLGNGERMSFFGEETALPRGAADLAMKTGAAILPAFSVRLPDGRFEIHAEPPIMVDASKNHDGARRATEEIVALIEKHVRRNPEQWVVFARVWEGN